MQSFLEIFYKIKIEIIEILGKVENSSFFEESEIT